MQIFRKTAIEATDIQIGDQIQVGRYTATCQELPAPGLAMFLLDQYLDKPMKMNKRDTNKGGYAASDLRKDLNTPEILAEFSGLPLEPIYGDDLLRLPCYGEIFGHDEWYNSGAVEPDNAEQWPLMKERANRVAYRANEWEWGWLQNKREGSAPFFCTVSTAGYAAAWLASGVLGVRPAFLIKLS